MSWRIYDYECPVCGCRKEHMVKDDEPVLCTTVHDGVACKTEMVRLIGNIIPPITIVRGNSDYKERERARLEERSRNHWNTKGKDEAIDRIRMRRKIDGI